MHDGRQTMPVVFTYMGMYNGLYRLGSLGDMLVGGFLADRYGIGITAITFLAIPFAYRLLPATNQQHAPMENKLMDILCLD